MLRNPPVLHHHTRATAQTPRTGNLAGARAGGWDAEKKPWRAAPPARAEAQRGAYWTVSVAVMPGWIVHTYLIVPALSGVNENVPPLPKSLDLKSAPDWAVTL